MDQDAREWLRSMGIDPDNLPESPFEPGKPIDLPYQRSRWHTRARRHAQRTVARVARPLSVPAERRRVGRLYAAQLDGATHLVVYRLDAWDRDDRRQVVEVHSHVPTLDEYSGPSCDLHLRWAGSQFYRRARKRWDNGSIAPSPYAWYAWLVPGERWTEELVDEAIRRWVIALTGRADLELCYPSISREATKQRSHLLRSSSGPPESAF
jgi:hypothetical protein